MPDPADIALPEMVLGSDPDVQKKGYKFFFHHNPEIDFALAHRDFSECFAQLATRDYLPLPGFVPWEEANNREQVERYINPYGLVGAVIGAIISPKMDRGLRNNKMRLCLERRGYVRFAVDEDAYEAVWEGEPSDVIARLAKLATMPAPQAEEVAE